MAYYAHSGNSALEVDGELLADHLRAVATMARKLAVAATADPAFAAAAHAAGLLHDLGKYQPAWQAYLRAEVACQGSGTSVPHAAHGAAAAARRLEHPLLAAAIRGHHAGLSDFHRVQQLADDPPADLGALLAVAREEIRELPDAVPEPAADGDEGAACRRLDLWARFLFSVLIDADRLETARFKGDTSRAPVALDPERLLTAVETDRAKRAGDKADRLTVLRNAVFAACVAAGEYRRGFFDLTVPTGGGKTLSGMAFALAHAKTHKLRRVFVVIPYLSIIEQNAADYRRVLGTDAVLEHHSAVVPDERPAGGPERPSAAELAAENWDAPVVVTTSVQFLETLLAATTRRCRRLHSVANSVVVLDEAQCLPAHLLDPLLDIFRGLVADWGCSVVFSTATQPAFRRTPTGLTFGLKPDELRPILPPALQADLFRDLNRVTYHDCTATPWDWDELVESLVEGPALCVLNTRRHAREVFDKLRVAVRDKYGDEAAKAVRHLSSAMCAEHRLAVLGKPADPAPGTVAHRLRHGQPCWLVSTQVVECGVDVDFPRAFRALGPLDGIVQTAGRCNREMRQGVGGGRVTVFKPADESAPPGLYATATGLARTVLGQRTGVELATDPGVFADYFRQLYDATETDAGQIQHERAGWNFATVAGLAKVIEDGGRSVIVPYGQGRRWVKRIQRRGSYTRVELRRLQRNTVSLNPRDFAAGRRLGVVVPLLSDSPDGPLALLDGCYDEKLGVAITGLVIDEAI